MTDSTNSGRGGGDCGAPADGGPCVLPKGHNRGRLDIPDNHRSAPEGFEFVGWWDWRGFHADEFHLLRHHDQTGCRRVYVTAETGGGKETTDG